MWSWQSAVQPSSIFWFWLQRGRLPSAQATGSSAASRTSSRSSSSDKGDSLAAVLFQGLVRAHPRTHTHIDNIGLVFLNNEHHLCCWWTSSATRAPCWVAVGATEKRASGSQRARLRVSGLFARRQNEVANSIKRAFQSGSSQPLSQGWGLRCESRSRSGIREFWRLSRPAAFPLFCFQRAGLLKTKHK